MAHNEIDKSARHNKPSKKSFKDVIGKSLNNLLSVGLAHTNIFTKYFLKNNFSSSSSLKKYASYTEVEWKTRHSRINVIQSKTDTRKIKFLRYPSLHPPCQFERFRLFFLNSFFLISFNL